MTGSAIDVRIDDKAVRQAFHRLAMVTGGNTKPVMGAIGQAVVASTQRRFVSQTSPDGQHWLPVNPLRAADKRNSRILTESGRLRSSINARPGNDSVRIGTNVLYAAIHQFGGVILPKNAQKLKFMMGGIRFSVARVVMPARPYLGISDDDHEEIRDIVLGALDRAIG